MRAVPTLRRMLVTKHLDWKVPLALLLLSAVPFAAGALRLLSLATGENIHPGNARFFETPLPAILHIVGASFFSIVGALQFSTWLRVQFPSWHRAAGRWVMACGATAAVTGAWMTANYSIPEALQGHLLYGVRIAVAVSMLVAIAAAALAIARRDFSRHRAWMIRAYALGQGAGTQVVIFLPWAMLIGEPSEQQRDALMSLAWLVNLMVAEWIIYRHRPHLASTLTLRP